MAKEAMDTAQEGVDGARVEASRLQGVNELLDMRALDLEQGGRPVAIPALDEGLQRPTVAFQGPRLTVAALDGLQPSYD